MGQGLALPDPTERHGSALYDTIPTEGTRDRARDTVPPASATNPVVISCNREDMFVDWRSRCVQSNVGDIRLNVEGERMELDHIQIEPDNKRKIS